MMKKTIFLLIAVMIAAILFLYPCGVSAGGKCAWKYIVIHHSGTSVGSLKRFDAYHRARGMENGVAYHFIIDNGTCGTKDGQIEVTRRWEKQIHGGHCRQDTNNSIGIGICLVGNFQKTRPTEKQFWSLVWLVKKLMKGYNIPLKNVVGHEDMKGEHTICPGRYFPMKRLRNELKKK